MKYRIREVKSGSLEGWTRWIVERRESSWWYPGSWEVIDNCSSLEAAKKVIGAHVKAYDRVVHEEEWK